MRRKGVGLSQILTLTLTMSILTMFLFYPASAELKLEKNEIMKGEKLSFLFETFDKSAIIKITEDDANNVIKECVLDFNKNKCDWLELELINQWVDYGYCYGYDYGYYGYDYGYYGYDYGYYGYEYDYGYEYSYGYSYDYYGCKRYGKLFRIIAYTSDFLAGDYKLIVIGKNNEFTKEFSVKAVYGYDYSSEESDEGVFVNESVTQEPENETGQTNTTEADNEALNNALNNETQSNETITDEVVCQITCGDYGVCKNGKMERTCVNSCIGEFTEKKDCKMILGITTYSKSWDIVKKGVENIFNIKGYGVYRLKLIFAGDFENVGVSLTPVRFDSLPEGNLKNIYLGFKIEKINFQSEMLEKAGIFFSVPISWLKENQLRAEEIALYRYNKGWSQLETNIFRITDDMVYYNSITPGFSYFAVAMGSSENKMSQVKQREGEDKIAPVKDSKEDFSTKTLAEQKTKPKTNTMKEITGAMVIQPLKYKKSTLTLLVMTIIITITIAGHFFLKKHKSSYLNGMIDEEMERQRSIQEKIDEASKNV